jgi:hypothetical protein
MGPWEAVEALEEELPWLWDRGSSASVQEEEEEEGRSSPATVGKRGEGSEGEGGEGVLRGDTARRRSKTSAGATWHGDASGFGWTSPSRLPLREEEEEEERGEEEEEEESRGVGRDSRSSGRTTGKRGKGMAGSSIGCHWSPKPGGGGGRGAPVMERAERIVEMANSGKAGGALGGAPVGERGHGGASGFSAAAAAFSEREVEVMKACRSASALMSSSSLKIICRSYCWLAWGGEE